jgi:hypothetical protein
MPREPSDTVRYETFSCAWHDGQNMVLFWTRSDVGENTCKRKHDVLDHDAFGAKNKAMTRDDVQPPAHNQTRFNVNITPTIATASQQAKAQDGIATDHSEAPQTQQCHAHAQ